MWLFVTFQFVGYVIVYLMTPYPIQWHLGSSVDRLFLHLTPTAIMAALIACFSEAQKMESSATKLEPSNGLAQPSS
jgi:hypothetical protein